MSDFGLLAHVLAPSPEQAAHEQPTTRAALGLTGLSSQQVEDLLASDPQKTDDGRFICQICGGVYDKLGPHQLGHRRQAGLAPPATGNWATVPDLIDCPECGTQMTKTSINSHLRSVHGLSMTEASFRAREVKQSLRGAPATTKRRFENCPRCGKQIRSDNMRRHLSGPHKMTARQAVEALRAMRNGEPINEPEPEPVVEAAVEAETNGHVSVLTDLSAAEAVSGILAAARSDKQIPTILLPAVLELIEHTDAVLTELRRLTE
jgi:rubredoxin